MWNTTYVTDITNSTHVCEPAVLVDIQLNISFILYFNQNMLKALNVFFYHPITNQSPNCYSGSNLEIGFYLDWFLFCLCGDMLRLSYYGVYTN
jgi:hypothetical protein